MPIEIGKRQLLALAGAGLMSLAHAQEAQQAKQAQEAQQAQQAQAAEQAPIARVEVRASADSYDPRRDDTAARIVVAHAELQKYGDASVVDALKRIPGVTVTSSGRGSDIRMRGLSGYTRILVNGERAPPGFSIDTLAPAQVERIEVFPSASAELSTESIAGTINIVLLRSVRQAQRQLQAGYGGSAGERTPRLVGVRSDRDGAFSYSMSANVRSTRFDRHGLIVDTTDDLDGKTSSSLRTQTQESGLFQIANLIPRLNWQLPSGDALSSETVLTYTRFHYGGVENGADSAVERTVRSRNAFIKSDLDWKTRLGADASLELKAGAQGSRARNDSARFGSRLAGDRGDVGSSERGASASGKWRVKLGEAQQWTAGWEASRSVRRENNDDYLAGAITPSRSTLLGTVTRTALFAQDEWAVTARWSIYLGVRGERLGSEIGGAGLTGKGATTTVWSPIAQTLLKLPGENKEQLRLALTRTFKAPELDSLLPRRRRVEINGATNPDFEGNAALRPELARGLDLSYERYFMKNALWSVSVSRRELDDYILSALSLGADGRWVARPVNAGRASVRSLALETKFPLAAMWAEAPALELRGSINRNWSSVAQVAPPANRVAQQIPLSATLALDYSRGALSGGASMSYLQGAWNRVTANQSVASGSRRDADLYALWKIDPQRQLRITIGNLLAQDSYSATQYRSGAGGSTRSILADGETSVRLLFEQRF